MLKIGRFQICTHVFGSFRLDGGAMFGSVPKTLWSRKIRADNENCIPLVTRSLVVRDQGRLILVDCGNGDKWSDKQREIFAFKAAASAPHFNSSDVTDLILTHLHFDHAGGVSRYVDGELALSYPQALHHLQKANLENALDPNVKERASYIKENVNILERAQLNLLDGSGDITAGITVHRVDGHTRGQQWIEISDGGECLFFPTDMIPTSHHVPLAYHMGYDIDAGTLLREKLELLNAAVKRAAMVVFEHDSQVAAARLKFDEKGNFALAETWDDSLFSSDSL